RSADGIVALFAGTERKNPARARDGGARSAGRVDRRTVDCLAPERGGDTPGATPSASAGAARTRHGVGRGVGIRRLLYGLDHLDGGFPRRRDSGSIPAALAD